MINQSIDIVSDGNYSILLNQDNLAWIRVKNHTLKKLLGNIELMNEFIQQISVKYHFFDDKDHNSMDINTVYFSVTNLCNMNCKFCTLKSGQFESSSNDLPLDIIQEVIKKVVKGFKPSTIVITGGEPTMRKDLLDILDICQKYRSNCSIMLQTNGLDLNGDIIEKLVKRLDLIEISVEHMIGKNNYISRLHKVLDYLKKTNMDVRLSYVIDKNTQNKILAAIDLCDQYDATFVFRFVAAVGRAASSDILLTENEIKEVFSVMSRHLLDKRLFNPKLSHGIFGTLNARKMCGAWGKTIGIQPNGKVQMCGNLVGDLFNYGDLTESSIDEIMCKIKSKLKSENIKSKFLLSDVEACSNCFARYFCGGACVAELENIGKFGFRCKTKKLYMLYLMFFYSKKYSIEENLINLVTFLDESNYDKSFAMVNTYHTSFDRLFELADSL